MAVPDIRVPSKKTPSSKKHKDDFPGWEATDLRNCPKRKHWQKWLGEGATGLPDPASKKGCTGAKDGLVGAKDSWETFAPWVQKTFCTLP